MPSLRFICEYALYAARQGAAREDAP
jgi:hypothetical protein